MTDQKAYPAGAKFPFYFCIPVEEEQLSLHDHELDFQCRLLGK
jgi:hypothetical protein